MKNRLTRLRFTLVFLGSLFAVASASAQGPKNPPGIIDANPATCKGNALCFEVKAAPDVAYDAFRSVYFYAVVLKTIKKCGGTEKERLKIQSLFPKNKVFEERNLCEDNLEDTVSYEDIGGDNSFIAVYAGKTKAEAEKFLRAVKATNKFPSANVRRTRAISSAD